MLAKLPGVQKSLDAIGQRLSGTEDQLRSWATNWDGLTARLVKVEKGVNANLRAAEDFAAMQAAIGPKTPQPSRKSAMKKFAIPAANSGRE